MKLSGVLLQEACSWQSPVRVAHIVPESCNMTVIIMHVIILSANTGIISIRAILIVHGTLIECHHKYRRVRLLV